KAGQFVRAGCQDATWSERSAVTGKLRADRHRPQEGQTEQGGQRLDLTSAAPGGWKRRRAAKRGKRALVRAGRAAVECRGEQRRARHRKPKQRFSPTGVYPPCPFSARPVLVSAGTADRPLFVTATTGSLWA